MKPATFVELPEGASVQHKQDTAGNDVSDGASGLEGSRRLPIIVTNQEERTVDDLTCEKQQVHDSFALTERQIHRVGPESLQEIEDHGACADKCKTEDKHALVQHCGDETAASQPVTLRILCLLLVRRVKLKEHLLKCFAHLFPGRQLYD